MQINEAASLMGKKGGGNTKKKYGKKHYKKMGILSGEKRRKNKQAEVIPTLPLDKQTIV